jgi:hypothetical protein
MASLTIHRTWEVNGTLVDPTSVILRDRTNAYGVKRADTGAVVIAAGTAFTKSATGDYEYTIEDVVDGATYIAATEVVYGGHTYHFETTHVADSDADSGTGIVTRSEVLEELGITTPTDAEESVIDKAILKATAAVRRYLGYDPMYAERTEYYPQRSYQAQGGRGVWEVTDTSAVLRQISDAATSEVQLQHLPIRGTPSVWVDSSAKSGTASGAFATETAYTEGTEFWANYDCQDAAGLKVCRDGLLRAYGSWPTEPGSVKVIYPAGYTAEELRGSDGRLDATPIWDAVLTEAVRRARQVLTMQNGTLGLPVGLKTSESLGSYSYSLDGASAARLFKGDLLDETKMALEAFVNFGFMLGS